MRFVIGVIGTVAKRYANEQRFYANDQDDAAEELVVDVHRRNYHAIPHLNKSKLNTQRWRRYLINKTIE